MIICVITNSVAFVHNARHQILMRPCVDAHEKEGGVDVGCFQHVEDGWGVEGVGTVVEGERHDGFVGFGAKQGIRLDGRPGGIGPRGKAAVGTHLGATGTDCTGRTGGQPPQSKTANGAYGTRQPTGDQRPPR